MVSMERVPYEAADAVEAMNGVHLAPLAAGERMSVQHFFVAEGDSYVIPGGVPHELQNDAEIPLRGIDVFSPPRDDPDWAQE